MGLTPNTCGGRRLPPCPRRAAMPYLWLTLLMLLLIFAYPPIITAFVPRL